MFKCLFLTFLKQVILIAFGVEILNPSLTFFLFVFFFLGGGVTMGVGAHVSPAEVCAPRVPTPPPHSEF